MEDLKSIEKLLDSLPQTPKIPDNPSPWQLLPIAGYFIAEKALREGRGSLLYLPLQDGEDAYKIYQGICVGMTCATGLAYLML